ncbi:MAG: nitrous oxide reductase accessory protein NosL [Saprospiraceae bacterium]|nr:nitrous oxide reductase accessory protein NosL [Saprospiraceae bacterium]
MKNITKPSRFVTAFASLAMLGSYFFPLWRIELWAPQYPEGLAMQIWHNKIGGDIEIINGLNHYIGMRHIKQEMFPEFQILPFLIAFFVVFGLIVAFVGKRKVLMAYLATMIVAGVVALGDFYRWGYDYGHNLDPNAAIKVPGMAYQPPVLGYKTLLNFGAYSIPDLGGWIFIGAGVVVALVLAYELYLDKKQVKTGLKIAFFPLFSLFFAHCASEIEPINYGKEACHFCKMTIVDAKFGAEIVTQKGKIFKFDDLHCLVSYLKKENIKETDLSHVVVNDYHAAGSFLPVKNAFFLKSEQFKSPMRGDIAAFKTEGAATMAKPNDAKMMNWTTVFSHF